MRRLLALITLTWFSAAALFGQGIPSEGKDFYLGYIYPSYNDVVPASSAGYYRVYAYVSSFQDNVVSVSYFDPQTKKEDYPANYPVKARQTTQIPLDRTRMAMTHPGDIGGEFKACHITSKKPVNVQFFSTGANSGGSYLALPVNAWGKKYVVASYKDNGDGQGAFLGGSGPGQLDLAAGVFLVIAAYDNTSVTITPTARTGGDHVGVNQGAGSDGTPRPYTVSLNRGQCWMVKSKSAQEQGTDDISASIVKADKPVAVIAGHENAMTEGGSTNGIGIEARDYMVEQMIPVEYWSSTGYISIPFGDSPTSTAGLGDNFRVFVSDANAPESIAIDRIGSSTTVLPTSVYEVANMIGNGDPAHFYNNAKKPFSVMQYDRRNHGSAAPYNAPSMMSVVPRDRWRNAYLWYVPTNVNEKIQAYYVSIIAIKDGIARYHEPLDSVITRNWFNDSIRVSKNGSNTFSKISALGSQKHNWTTIPGHPDLQASIYQVSPGTSYYIQAPFPFMVYSYGTRAFSYDGFIGDYNGDDYFFSYALPLGMALHVSTPMRLGITVDTLCTGWRICVRDSNNPGGIKSVTLLDDPNGDIIVGGHYQYKNTSFSPEDDPLNLKEIVYNPPKSDVCFTVRVDNPGADAIAPLYIVDMNGNGKVIQLRFKKIAVSFSPPDSVGLVLQQFDPVSRHYIPNYVNEEVCKDYLFVNDIVSSKTFTLSKVEIPQPSNFTIKGVTPVVGTSIKPGDSVRMTVCFVSTDTLMYLDSIEFETDCWKTLLPVSGQAGTPLIVADDYDFGTILIGTKKCKDIEVKNVGNKPFTLDSNWILNNFGEITFDPVDTRNSLPRTLGPGQTHKFRVCYQPVDHGIDSARMDWSTDIRTPYENAIKSYSEFWGKGIRSGVNWDRAFEGFRADSTVEVISRVNLVNTSTADAQLTGIWIDGTDADEFRIVETEFKTNPPTYSGTVVSVGDTMWVDIGFKLDMTKTPITRTRTAFLRTSATLDTASIPTIALSARFGYAVVKQKGKQNALHLRPNPARDRIALDLELEAASAISVAIYDVLGREVLARTMFGETKGWNTFVLPLPHVAPGMYMLVVKTGGATAVRQLVVE